MLNVLTFNSSTTNSALVITLHIYLYAYIPPTNYLNEPSPSGLVIHAFESVGDKGSQGVEESEPADKEGAGCSEVCRGFQWTALFSQCWLSPPAASRACLVVCECLAECPAKLLI